MGIDKCERVAYTLFGHMQRHGYKRELRRLGLRATPARIAVMEFLEKTKLPVDVNAIIDFLSRKKIKTDPATVFRITNVLTDKNLLIPIQLQEGKMRFELAKRPHHHHFMCEACGKIEDVLTRKMMMLEEEIRKKHNFLIKRHSLEFFGLCSDCQS